MDIKRKLSLAALVLLLAACAGNPKPLPAIYDLSLDPKEVNPGESVKISFAMDYAGDWNEITGISLLGLPENTLFANTVDSVNIPSSKDDMAETVIVIKKPAKAGAYPLRFEIAIADSPGVIVNGVGTLVINDVVSRVEFAGFEPGSHKVNECLTDQKTVILKYVAYDENGAADIQRPKISDVTPTRLLSDQQPPIDLNVPRQSNLSEELVSTPMQINCNVVAPQKWQWTLTAVDTDALSGDARSIEPAIIEYFTDR